MIPMKAHTSKMNMAVFLTVAMALSASAAASKVMVTPEQPAKLFPLRDVRLLESPFSEAVKANRHYLLAHDPDRLLAPFRREAGLEPKAQPYGNWESGGLDGHTAGHYLSALSLMVASGADPNGEFRRRLDYMIDELADVQKANGNGYIGGIPKSEEYWKSVADGHVELMRNRWAPWYNLHKMFAGLRDAYLNGGNEKARDLLVRYGDWCEKVTSGLTDGQMQRMIGTEYGGMNEVLADIYAITGDSKYIEMAKRFNHRAVFEPLEHRQDRLTGLHANTQIPKITGMERIAALVHDAKSHTGAEFFWETVTQNRSVAFGGNSVSEHFNNPKDFSGMVGHREGPETCNTYNMLRLTKELFKAEPNAAYADFYERALYNHILASINPKRPGYVYFTPIRPAHYRVYSQPEQAFWCCVGTGMENPGRYGEFIYTRAKDGVYVNLFIPSELSVPDDGMVLRQETAFPDEGRTQLSLQLDKPMTFTLNIRHPGWVDADGLTVKVNGRPVAVVSSPSSYIAIRREWNNGDRIEVSLPMRTTIERLPDGSDWVAIKHGPIVLASPCGEKDMPNLYADSSRMGHVASGPVAPLDSIPVILSTTEELPRHIVPDPQAGPLHFRLVDVIEPVAPKGVPLEPFFRLHDQRYQMYWQLTATAVQAEPALKDVFKDTFLIGGALNRRIVTGRDSNAAAIAEKHFNTATAENDLKWQLIHPRPNQYNWEPADSYIAFCENNDMFATGHCLVWHSQTPRWVFQDDAGNPLTRDALLARMKDHIKTVVGRYRGRIKGWDVVNEALNEDGTLRSSQWLRIIGEGSDEKQYDHIEHAFQWAHEADPGAELYYNDYSLETSKAKCDGAVAIVKHLQSKGIHIDGVGIQLHASLAHPSVEGLEYAITSLAATGVKVMITELDIRTRTRGYRGADISRVNRDSTDDPTAVAAETQKKLADKYAEIFSVLLKHRKDVTRVTLWGVYDGASWIGGSPLLFDRSYQPKEAFFAVVKAAQESD